MRHTLTILLLAVICVACDAPPPLETPRTAATGRVALLNWLIGVRQDQVGSDDKSPDSWHETWQADGERLRGKRWLVTSGRENPPEIMEIRAGSAGLVLEVTPPTGPSMLLEQAGSAHHDGVYFGANAGAVHYQLYASGVSVTRYDLDPALPPPPPQWWRDMHARHDPSNHVRMTSAWLSPGYAGK